MVIQTFWPQVTWGKLATGSFSSNLCTEGGIDIDNVVPQGTDSGSQGIIGIPLAKAICLA